MVEVQLNYDTGLNPYYGLVPIAVKYDIFKKVSTRIELPDGKTAFEKSINNDPEKYWATGQSARTLFGGKPLRKHP